MDEPGGLAPAAKNAIISLSIRREPSSLYVITRNVQTELVVQKSRFLTSLYRVSTEQEAQIQIKALKKEYWDASHNCSAYIVGINPRAERSSDDGEPAGTAGAPMLEVLRQKELYNVVAVVTRYFGGIKLGAGGLTRTYAKAVSEAIKASGLSCMIPMGDYAFTWPIDDVGRVLNHLYGKPLFSVKDVQYDDQATIILTCKRADQADVTHFLTESLRSPVSLEELRLFEAEEPLEASHS